MSSPAQDKDLSGVYLAHFADLSRWLANRVGSRDLAEEAMQETWLRLAGNRSALPQVNDPQAYILRVAGNIAIDIIRRERRHSARQISDDATLMALIDETPGPEATIIAREQLRQLVRALITLSDKARNVLLMNRCSGMGHREIAARLGISESMVAKYMAQALRHCRDGLRKSGI